MSRGIIIFGASGSGTTTIGRELARISGFRHFDLDDYYWRWDTEVPYTLPREKTERVALLMRDIAQCPFFVMSGSLCGWGDAFVPLFDMAVFVQTPTEIRIDRLHARELKVFGDRILEGGDMYAGHNAFLDWAGSYDEGAPPERCLKLHERWAAELPCPVLRVDGTKEVAANAELIMRQYEPKRPSGLCDLLTGFTCTKDRVGCSAAGVYHYLREDVSCYLKIDMANAELTREYQVMHWLDGKLPVPRVLYFGETDGLAYLLMTAVEGNMACDCPEDVLHEPYETTVRLLAEGIRMLESVDISDCPFQSTLDIKLPDALYNIENGLVDMADFEEWNDFETPMALYDYLVQNRPTEELCFCHGDYCLPNVFIDGERVTGFIDLGRCGIADMWQDIALCVRSLGYNLRHIENRSYIDLLFKRLNIVPDWEKIRYYILLDELF